MMYNNHNLIGLKNNQGTEAGRRISKAVIETLEGRQLMSSAALIDGTLTVTGNDSINNYMSVRLMDDGETLEVKANTKTRTFALADVEAIQITGTERSDIVRVDSKLDLPVNVKTFGGNDIVTTDGRAAHNGDVRYDRSSGKNIVLNTNAGLRVASFTLINADTDEIIAEYKNLGDGMTVNLANLPTKNLNIRANVVNDTGGSVVFDFDGKSSLENFGHYTLAGNHAGDYHAWTPSTGEFKLSATPYSLNGAAGLKGEMKSITINFTNGSEPAEAKPMPQPAPKPVPQPSTRPVQDNTGEVGAPVPVISAISKTVQAGHSIHVNALSSTFKSGDALSAKYEWNFGDEGSKWDTLAGWNAAHVYGAPGTYTITLRVTNAAGKVATTSTYVTVGYSTRTRIYVSNEGSDSNDGTSQNDAIRSFGKALSMATSNTEILFKRGDVFTTENGGRIAGRNVVISAYGTGSRPVLKYTGPAEYEKIIVIDDTSRDVTIRGLAFDMRFTDLEKQNRPDAIGAAGTNVTIQGNEFINIGYAINASNGPRGLLVVDNVAPRSEAIRSYFVWANGSDISIVGNKVANSTREHNVRVVGADRVLIAHNDLTNSTNQVSGDETPKGTLTIHQGSYVYISRNKLSGGPVAVGPLGDGDGLKDADARWNWAVVEENEFGDGSRMLIDHGAAHVMVRENVFGDTSRSPVEVEGWNATYKRGTSDVRIEDNNALQSGKVFVKPTGGDVDVDQTNNDFVSSTARLSLWSAEGVSSPTQWQPDSTIFDEGKIPPLQLAA